MAALAIIAVGCGATILAAQTAKPADLRCKANPKDAACTRNSTTTSAPASPANDNPLPVEDSKHGGNVAPEATGKATPAPSPASDNPFPVEDSKQGSTAAPRATGKAGPAPSPASENPFPVEDSKHGRGVQGNNFSDMPTAGVPDPPASSERPIKLPPSGYSTSSSGDDTPGTSSSRSPADDDVAPTTAAPDAPVKASALKDFGSHGDTSLARAKLEQTRLADDLKIGSFYMKDGNPQGAYLRFKDAVDHAPDDPDAHFNLAEAASKLNKHDEAVLNYRECLRLDPAGDHDKASRKALGRMGAAVQ